MFDLNYDNDPRASTKNIRVPIQQLHDDDKINIKYTKSIYILYTKSCGII